MVRPGGTVPVISRAGGAVPPVERRSVMQHEAAIPDAVLRANRDSLVVTFYTHSNSEFLVSFRRDLLDGYLRAVDSVSTALRSKATKTK